MAVNRLIIEILGKDKATPALKKTGKELKNLDKQASTTSKGMSGLATALGAAGIAFAGKQVLTAVVDLAQLGAQAQRTEAAFVELATQAGGSADDILAAIQRASGGTISEMDTMAAANRGILLGLGANADQWGELTEVARFRARAMGLTVTQALSDITTAIGRESKMIADNLGFVWDLDQIMSDYAATLGTTADQLDGTERKQALLNATVQQGQEQIQAAGGITEDAADKFEIMNAAVGDAKVAIGEALAPAVSELASALGEAIPKLVETTSQLSILANAGVAWAQAALAGADAEAAFNAQVAQSVGATQEAARIRMEAAQQEVDSIKERIAAYKEAGQAEFAAIAEQDLLQAAEAELALAKAMHDVAAGTAVADTGMRAWISTQAVATAAAKELAAATEGASESAFRLSKRYASMDFRSMQLERVDQLREQSKEDEKKRADEVADAWEDAIDRQERAYERLRGTISSALQATTVTPMDMDLSATGDYVDKWDENARRLDAIAQRGFGELQEHADWASILKIPPELLSGSEAALKAWASNTANAVRDLSRPDLINVEAAADAVERFMQAEAAKEMTIDLVIGELQARGATAESAQKAVQQLYGGEEGMPMPVNLILAEDAAETFREETGPLTMPINLALAEEGMGGGGETVGTQLLAGIEASMVGMEVGNRLVAMFKADIKASEDGLNNSGKMVWGLIELGIFEAMAETNLADKFMEMIAVIVQRMASAGDLYEGGEGEP